MRSNSHHLTPTGCLAWDLTTTPQSITRYIISVRQWVISGQIDAQRVRREIAKVGQARLFDA